MHEVDHEALATRLERMRSDIADASRAASRNPDDVTLIVVTKFHPEAMVRALHQLGVRDVGENRHQEAQHKAEAVSDLDLNWHFIGQLQSNKAKAAAAYAQAIHSIDRPAVVKALAGIDHRIDGFIQVNLTSDPGRGGVQADALDSLVEQVLATPTIRLRGVMAVAPLDEPAAPAFERLAGISARVQLLAPEAREISAGMTHDFREAIAHGATHLRVGTAITGNRPD